MQRFRYSLFIDIISAVFILLFTYTAISKLGNLRSFRIVLTRSPLIGDKAVIMAWIVPLTELVVAGLLFFVSTRGLGLKASFLLMVLFTLYIGYMLVFTPHLPCSCGGVIRQLSWKEHLVFNIALTGLVAWGIALVKKRNRLTRISDNSETLNHLLQ
jgi:hypothetical protein